MVNVGLNHCVCTKNTTIDGIEVGKVYEYSHYPSYEKGGRKHMEVKVGDKYVLHSINGMNYCISIVNVSEYRCREERYGAYICDENGNYDKDIFFFGDKLLSKCKKIN